MTNHELIGLLIFWAIPSATMIGLWVALTIRNAYTRRK